MFSHAGGHRLESWCAHGDEPQLRARGNTDADGQRIIHRKAEEHTKQGINRNTEKRTQNRKTRRNRGRRRRHGKTQADKETPTDRHKHKGGGAHDKKTQQHINKITLNTNQKQYKINIHKQKTQFQADYK